MLILKGVLLFGISLFTAISSDCQIVPNKQYERKLAKEEIKKEEVKKNDWIEIHIDTPLYVGIVNHVQIEGVNMDEFYRDSFSSSFSETSTPGKYQGTFSIPGIVRLSFRNKTSNRTAYIFYYKVIRLPKDQLPEEPTINIGNSTNNKISISTLQQEKELGITKGFTFKSAVVYFSGTNFNQVPYQHIFGNSLSQLDMNISKCKPGSQIIFDNIKVTDIQGKEYTIAGKAFEIIN
jgi:hypothetical protein